MARKAKVYTAAQMQTRGLSAQGSPRFRVWVRSNLQISHLGFDQRRMLDIGQFGLKSVLERVRNVRNMNDAPSKPLATRYARWKSKVKGPGAAVRNLTLTGKMLGNFKVRTVSADDVVIRPSTVRERQKARNNERIEPWVGFSPQNVQRVVSYAKRLFYNQPIVVKVI